MFRYTIDVTYRPPFCLDPSTRPRSILLWSNDVTTWIPSPSLTLRKFLKFVPIVYYKYYTKFFQLHLLRNLTYPSLWSISLIWKNLVPRETVRPLQHLGKTLITYFVLWTLMFPLANRTPGTLGHLGSISLGPSSVVIPRLLLTSDRHPSLLPRIQILVAV